MAETKLKLPLHIITICLDAFPWLPSIFVELNRVQGVEFYWHLVEGAAMNGGSTAWCSKQEPRLSRDGTTEFINSISHHPRVATYQNDMWASKDEMVNCPLQFITEPCVLMQIDSDEIWTARQIQRIVSMFESDPLAMNAVFRARHFVGPNLIVTSKTGWTNEEFSFRRAWRFEPGMRFDRHEPPILAGNKGKCIGKDETERLIGRFDHFSYAVESQVAYKQAFYGPTYANAVDGWRRLQAHTEFPIALTPFFSWVGPEVTVGRV